MQFVDQFLAIWNSTSYMQVYSCNYFQCKLNWTTNYDLGTGTQWVTDNIQWGFDCKTLYIQYDNLLPATVYQGHTGRIINSYAINQIIYNFSPIGDADHYGALALADGTFKFYQLNNTMEHNIYTPSYPLTKYSIFLRVYRRIITFDESYVNVQRLQCSSLFWYYGWYGLCLNCSNTCLTCNQITANCITCMNGYQIDPTNNRLCRLIPVITPTNTSTNTSTNATILNETFPFNFTINYTILVDSNTSTTTNNTNNTNNANNTHNTNNINNTNNSNINSTVIIIQPTINNTTTTTINNNVLDVITYDNYQSNVSSQLQLKYGSHYQYESTIAEVAVNSFQVIGQVIGVTFSILQIAPLAWLFLSFMNFWSIISYYMFLINENVLSDQNSNVPQYLRVIIRIIYDKINQDIFGLQYVGDCIYQMRRQRLEYMKDNYGISSSFIGNNFQAFLSLIICIISSGLMILVIRYIIPDSYWIKIRFDEYIDIRQIISSQYISMSSTIILGFRLIMSEFNQYEFRQLGNIILHILFIGFSLIFPFIIINKQISNQSNNIQMSNKYNNKYKSNKYNNKKKRYVSSNQYINYKQYTNSTIKWIYYSNCNTLLPFLCVINIPSIYYLFAIIYFSIGIYIAKSFNHFNLNQIILASYPLLFHITFTIITLFGSYSLIIKHYGAIICTIIMFIGAIHQLIAMLIKIVYFIVKQIYMFCTKVSNYNPYQIQQQTNKQQISNKQQIKANICGLQIIPDRMKSKMRYKICKKQQNVFGNKQGLYVKQQNKMKIRIKKRRTEHVNLMYLNNNIKSDNKLYQLSQTININNININNNINNNNNNNICNSNSNSNNNISNNKDQKKKFIQLKYNNNSNNHNQSISSNKQFSINQLKQEIINNQKHQLIITNCQSNMSLIQKDIMNNININIHKQQQIQTNHQHIEQHIQQHYQQPQQQINQQLKQQNNKQNSNKQSLCKQQFFNKQQFCIKQKQHLITTNSTKKKIKIHKTKTAYNFNIHQHNITP